MQTTDRFKVGQYVSVHGERREIDECGRPACACAQRINLHAVFLEELPPDNSGEPGVRVFDLTSRTEVEAALSHCSLLSPESVRADLTGFQVGFMSSLRGRIASSYVSRGRTYVAVSGDDGSEYLLPLSQVELCLRRKNER